MYNPDNDDIEEEEAFSRPSEVSDLPDHPPWYCPVCGELVDMFYASVEGVIVGCDNCVSAYYPYRKAHRRSRA